MAAKNTTTSKKTHTGGQKLTQEKPGLGAKPKKGDPKIKKLR